MNTLYTTHDVAKLLQVDPSTVSKWIDKAMLTAFRTPGGHRRVRAADLRNFVRTYEMPMPAELSPGPLRLLAVDDEQTALDALKRQLKPHTDRIELVTTTSAVEALLLLAEQSWD